MQQSGAFDSGERATDSALEKGADSHLMIFDVDLVLFSKRNQHNGRSFAFVFVGAARIDR
jgi:hypothetical protein